ncbi:hypothetical protein HPP92_019027 [Vanilla planifolia]|uniref:SHSP domain-containing protein n=1 Tax=Vanilla planifolia TaxID=51239 RepID=A0A835Q524_VANPL|nr:hypothetical protein HPP92_019027 [Vanilla planifolia]
MTEPRSYVDFKPRAEWFKGKESNTLMVDVTGFRKEDLKVVINTGGNLKVTGERPIEGEHWSRFALSFNIPRESNPRGIQAKYDGDEGLLYVILPNFTPPAATPVQAQDTTSTPKPHEMMIGEEERGRTAGERRGFVAYPALNKRKLLLLCVIIVSVMLSLGLAVYLSYRLRGL